MTIERNHHENIRALDHDNVKKTQDVVESDSNVHNKEEDKEKMHQEKKTDEKNGKRREQNEILMQQRTKVNTDALVTATGQVKPVVIEAELQCIICQYAMFKPMTVVCGHSFCRVCLLDSLLMRPIEEAHCPICRVHILQPFLVKSSLASVFSINVTLWSLGQLLIPSVTERIASYHDEEELRFSNRLDQLDIKWKAFALSKLAARYHGDKQQEDVRSLGRWSEDGEGRNEYPVLKVEDTRDGDLYVSRNIVLDTNDENEDGYVNMRVGIAIVEFPSIFELYNEHQECSVNVIKMEEDEEMADGMPFFMNDNGDDDVFVCSSYYNVISLHVCDEAGNCVMERSRGAQGGVVTFPGLRLDVPGGLYTFHFTDDLYGLKLSIATRLREPHEISDAPVADYVSLIYDEAKDAGRRNRSTHSDSNSEREFDEEESELDDSFIVDDSVEEDHNEAHIGSFSDDNSEDDGEHHNKHEADDEASTNQLQTRQWQRFSRQSEGDVANVDVQSDDVAISIEQSEQSDGQDNVDEYEKDETGGMEVRPGRCGERDVEALDSLNEEAGRTKHDTVGAAKENKTEAKRRCPCDSVCPSRQNANQIVDSDDEDEEKDASAGSDEKQKADECSGDGAQNNHDGEGREDETGNVSPSLAMGYTYNEGDGTVAPSRTKKTNRAQLLEDGKSDDDDNLFCIAAIDEDVREGRPRKRSRKVRVINDGESDEEHHEVMER